MLIFTFTKPVGGILFGIAFWAVAKAIRQTSFVRDYVIIAGYGLLLLFISNQAVTLISVPYPPAGLVSTLFVGLSSYLILVGIYSSAISVSDDSKLLDSIGTAHIEQEIQKRVITLTKQNQDSMAEETGIQSSLTEEDMKQYLEQVISEVKKQKTSTERNSNKSRSRG